MIELRTLGGVDLRGPEGRELRSIVAGPKRLALLAYLALQSPSGYQRRDTLLGLFWPELDSDHARNSLRNALSILRRGLGTGVLVTRGDEEVRLEIEGLWCDSVEFERALDRGDLEQALGLYRGDLLEGFFVRGALEFEQWLESRRTALRERAAQAAWRLAEKQEAERNVVGAGHWARRAGAFAPYDEDVQRRLIGLLDRLGDRSGALAAYEALARRLAADLEVEPTPETRALVEHIRTRTATAGSDQVGPDATPQTTHDPRIVLHSSETKEEFTDIGARDVSPGPELHEAALIDKGAAPTDEISPALGRISFRRALRSPVLAVLACVLLLGAGLALLLRRGTTARGAEETAAISRSVRAVPPGAPARTSRAIPTSAASDVSVAVLPFSVRGGELGIWKEGMVDLLSINLTGLPGLRPVDSRTVLARWREQAGSAEMPDLKAALRIARGTGARYAVVGNAISNGPNLRLTATVYDVADSRSLRQEQVQGPQDSIFGLVDGLSLALLRSFPAVGDSALARVNLARATTSSLPALKAYLEGEVLFRRFDFNGAVSAYRHAFEADTNFALPVARLVSPWSWGQDFDIATPERLRRLLGRLSPHEGLMVRAGLVFGKDNEEAVALLRQAAAEYPDDADIWYALGEAYFHNGGSLLVEPAAADSAFSKAVELDPGFAPAYFHLVNLAFSVYADSALAASRIEAYGRLAAGDPTDQWNRIALGLAFGDSASRSRALSGLDTLPGIASSDIAWDYLSHPRLQAAQQLAIEASLRRASWGENRRGALEYGYYADLARGRLHAALEEGLSPLHDERRSPAYIVFLLGLAELPEAAEKELAAIPADSSDDIAADIAQSSFYAGAYAADQGRWADYDAALAQLGNDPEARASATALEGYGLWRRGRPAEALPVLETARRRLGVDRRDTVVRWWLGKLLLELGRPEDAERYFSSFRNAHLQQAAAYFLAKAYEAQGEYERARDAYAYFTVAWSHADREVQPMVEDARGAVTRLSKLVHK